VTPPAVPGSGLAGQFRKGLVVDVVAECRLVQAVAGQCVEEDAESSPRQPGRAAPGAEQVAEVDTDDSQVAFDLAAVLGYMLNDVSRFSKGKPVTSCATRMKSTTSPFVGPVPPFMPAHTW
jgi:hypothetical protein